MERVEVAAIAHVLVAGGDLQLSAGLLQGAGELARVQLPSALENGDGLPGPGQPARRDRPAIARADDHGGVRIAELGHGSRERDPHRARP